MKVRLTVLGSGTSTGVPMPGCACAACVSTDPRDNRWRASVLVEWGGRAIVVDTTPEFRLQMLRARVTRLDAVFFTHNHADHVHGFDDVRSFNIAQAGALPVYAAPEMCDWIRSHFAYIWNPIQRGGGLPQVDLRPVEGPFDLFGLRIVPLVVRHGVLEVRGWRFGDIAYIPDVSEVPAAARSALAGVRILILDAVRYRPHTTHLHVDGAVAVARECAVPETWLTHLGHDLVQAKLEKELPPGVRPAYDGLVVEAG